MIYAHSHAHIVEDKMAIASRKPTNLTLDTKLVNEARLLKLNVSRAAEAGLAEAIKTERMRLWQEENAQAVEDANGWVEKNGLPLGQHRLF